MPTKYWVGGNGNSNDTAHWALASGGGGGDGVPDATENVIFDTSSSLLNAAYTFTVNAAFACKDFTMDGPDPADATKVTWEGAAAMTIDGKIDLSGTTTGITLSYTGAVTMTATAGGTVTIASNSLIFLSNFTFNKAGATFRLVDDFKTKGNFTLTAGTFDATTNSRTVTLSGTQPTITPTVALTFYNLSMIPVTPSKTDHLTLTGNITITNLFTVSDGATATNRVLVWSNSMGTTRTITAASTSIANADFQDIYMQSTAARTITNSANGTGGNVRFTTSAAHGLIAGATNIKVAGTINYNGTWTVSALIDATHFEVAVAYVSDQAGTWTLDLSAATNGSGDCGGNLGITFTAAVDQHWTNVNGGTYSTVANWTSRVPLPQDNVFMDCGFGTSKTVTVDMPRLGKSVDWTGATWTTALTWDAAGSFELYGSLTMIDNLTMTGATTLTFSARGNYTFHPHSITFDRSIQVNYANPSGKLTLKGDLIMSSTRTLYIFSGVEFSCVDGGNNYVLSTGHIYIVAGTLTLGSATHLLTGTGSPMENYSGVITASTGTLKITDTSNSAVTFTGGSRTYNNIWFNRGASTGNITIVGNNTFTDFKDTGTEAHSILFTAASTQHVTTFTVNGSAGKLIIINSTTTGIHNLIKDGGGIITCDYLSIQHSVATPTLTWLATNSTNNQAVVTAGSGWYFGAFPGGKSGSLMMMGVGC